MAKCAQAHNQLLENWLLLGDQVLKHTDVSEIPSNLRLKKSTFFFKTAPDEQLGTLGGGGGCGGGGGA